MATLTDEQFTVLRHAVGRLTRVNNALSAVEMLVLAEAELRTMHQAADGEDAMEDTAQIAALVRLVADYTYTYVEQASRVLMEAEHLPPPEDAPPA